MLQITSPAAVGLFRAILEDPLDDVPRLLLADVLEEAGEGERASFIRCQCELAQMDAPWCKTEARENNCEELGLTTLCDWCALRRRERELLGTHGYRWKLDVNKLLVSRLADGVFRRGFVAAVTLTCADWCGAVCQSCQPPGRVIFFRDCLRCHGTGRTGGHGTALVLAAPIEQVNIVSVHNGRGEDLSAINNLLREIHEQIDPGAVSNALLAWARQEAGLPPLRS